MVERVVETEQQIEKPRSIRASAMSVRLDGEEKMQAPDPGERPKPEFEHARPVDADQRRIVSQPAREFLSKAIGIPAVGGQPGGTSQHQPVLMAIEFPNDLVITD